MQWYVQFIFISSGHSFPLFRYQFQFHFNNRSNKQNWKKNITKSIHFASTHLIISFTQNCKLYISRFFRTKSEWQLTIWKFLILTAIGWLWHIITISKTTILSIEPINKVKMVTEHILRNSCFRELFSKRFSFEIHMLENEVCVLTT